MPAEVAYLEEIEEIAQRYHCLPTDVEAAPVWLRKHYRVIKRIEDVLDAVAEAEE